MPAAARQLSFDYLLGHADWFDIADTAKAIGMGKRYTENAFDAGLLAGHEHNAAAGSRMTKRIPRYWIQGYLVKTATYDHAMKLQLATGVLDAFAGDKEALVQLRRHVDHLLTK